MLSHEHPRHPEIKISLGRLWDILGYPENPEYPDAIGIDVFFLIISILTKSNKDKREQT